MAGWSPVLFNSVDISALSGVLIEAIDHHKRPIRLSKWQKLARSHGKKLVNSEYGEKLIVIRGVLSGVGRGGYETNRDTLMRYLDAQEGILRFPQSGANRDYTCTVDDVDFPEMPSGGMAKFTIKFIASNPPFGLDTSNTTAVNSSGLTGSSMTKGFTAIGGSVAARPLITITLASGSGLTNKYIRIMNPRSGKYIQVTRTWVAADILIIDVDAKTVKVNGTSVDYSGFFPDFDPSDTSIQYDDTLTTRSVTINMVYKKRWL